MSVTVQLMSSDKYNFTIFEGYSFRNLRNELCEKLNIEDIERLIFFDENNEEFEDYELVEKDTFVQAFIRDPNKVRISYNENLKKIDLFFNDEFLDAEKYRRCIENGRSYKEMAVPDRPFIIEVDSSMNEESYRYIINDIRQYWIGELNNDYEWNDFGPNDTISFVKYYKNFNNYDYDVKDDDDDSLSYVGEEEKDVIKLLDLDPSHHIYMYLRYYLPRKRNTYDNYLNPIQIVSFKFL